MEEVKKENSLSVLTFNAGLFNLILFGRNWASSVPYVNRRLRAMPAALAETGADVIALQEIYSRRHRRFLVKKLKKVYPYSAYNRKKKKFFSLVNGLLILSKYPIARSKMEFYRGSSFLEKIFVDKGILSATIVMDSGKKVNIITTHTSAGDWLRHPEHKSMDRIRESQMLQLFDFCEEQKDDVIIAGDLNTGPGVSDSNYQLISRNNLLDVYKHVWGVNEDSIAVTWDPKNHLSKKGFHSSSPPQRIDHIIIPSKSSIKVLESKITLNNPTVRLRSKRRVTLSDHYGVIAKFEIK